MSHLHLDIKLLQDRIARREHALETDPTKQEGFHRLLAEALLNEDRHELMKLTERLS